MIISLFILKMFLFERALHGQLILWPFLRRAKPSWEKGKEKRPSPSLWFI